jgi:hypothetical protein
MAASGSFWARRKAAVEAEAAAEVAANEAQVEAVEAEALAASQADKTEAEILQELGLPNPDTLVQGDDFAAFMGRAVPEYLRRRALRKLWVSNPILANLDGLLDHGEDYTDAATVIPGMQTAYQVGKGMTMHIVALAEAAAAKAEAEARAETLDVVALAEAPVEPEVAPPEAAPIEDTVEPKHEPRVFTDAEDHATARPRRHMRFEFTS